MVSRAAAIYRATGLGAISTLSDSNPMTLPEDVGTIDEQVSLNLSLPDRFPGERAGAPLALAGTAVTAALNRGRPRGGSPARAEADQVPERDEPPLASGGSSVGRGRISGSRRRCCSSLLGLKVMRPWTWTLDSIAGRS